MAEPLTFASRRYAAFRITTKRIAAHRNDQFFTGDITMATTSASVLGHNFMDRITGFQGVCTGYVQYITGCNQLLLSPKSDDGKTREAHWFDEQRLLLDESAPRIVLDNGASPGCDIAAPIR